MDTLPAISPPPEGSSDTIQIIGWVASILVPILGAILATWWRAKTKRAEEAADKQRALAEAETERIRSERDLAAENLRRERDLIAETYAREAEQQREFYRTIMDEVKQLRERNLDLERKMTALEHELHQLQSKLEYYESNPANVHARKLFAEVFDAMQNPAWICDIVERTWYINTAYARQFGVNRGGFWDGIRIYGLYNDEDVASYLENDLRVTQAGTTIELEERIRKQITNPRCEEFITAKFRKTPVKLDGKPYIFGQQVQLISEHE